MPVHKIMENTELQSLIITADNLVKKLREIHEDPRYSAVWKFWDHHGMRYSGPFYVDELDSLERAVKVFTCEQNSRGHDGGSKAVDEGSV